MKINEILKEGFWSGLGNLAHGAVLGATGAMKNAPSSMNASTRLAADPSKMKALPTTFTPKPTPDSDTEKPTDQAEPTVQNIGDQQVPEGKRLYVIAKSNKEMYFKTADGRWWHVPNQNFPDSGMVVASNISDVLDRLTQDTVDSAKIVDVAAAKAKQNKSKKRRR